MTIREPQAETRRQGNDESESEAIRFLRYFGPLVAATNGVLVLIACELGGWATIGVMAFHAPILNACLGLGGLLSAVVPRPRRASSSRPSRGWRVVYSVLLPIAAYLLDVALILTLERLGLVRRGGC